MGQVVAVRDAMAVGDDQRWTVVGFRFLEGLDRVHVLRADGDTRHVHRSVAYGFHRKVLLAGGLAASGKLRYCATRRGLRHLAAGVGVGLGIEHQDLDVLARSKHLVYTAEADVVRPSIAANDPHALAHERIDNR